MSSEAAGANGAVLDTSWINEPAGGSGGATSRGRGGSKRRTRRRTLSPSIGKHNYMSNVDFNDPMNFPSLPSSGGSKVPSSSSSSSSSNCSSSSNSGGGADVPADDAAAEGVLRLMVTPHPPPSSPSRKGTAVSADPPSAAAGYSASPSHSATSQDADMPDPTVIAGLFDIEGVPITSPGPGPGPLPLGTLGALGNLEVVKTSSSVSQKKKEAEPRSSGKEPRGSTARGRNNRRATFGGVNARAFLEAENLEPVLPSKPPARAAVDAAAAAATKASPSTTTTAEVHVGAGQLQGSSNLATAPQGDVGGEERANSQPRAAKQKTRSRSSRRRSIVMPSEAQPLMDSDLDDGRAEHATAVAAVAAAPAPAPASASPTSTNKGGESAAGKETAATDSGDGKSKPGGSSEAGSSGNTTPSEEFPLSSVNATSCLSRSLAAQRGWALGDQDTRKQLFRAYYAAASGSQRARRIAARLFCLTGYALSPVAPEDARVLCAAAGDGMDWGLDETEPRLVSQPIRRETKEQKRELVLRIKPLFDLMEKASSKEKLSAEAATGVVSRKASPDGYRYEDRETGKPVDPGAYKVPYLEHVRAVRASRVKEFAAQRVTASSPAPTLPEAVNSSTPAAGVVASVDNGTISPAAAAAASPATTTVAAREVGEARLEEGVKPAAAATEADLGSEAANVDVAEKSAKEGRLLEDVSVPDEVLAAEASSEEGPLEETDAAATSAEEDKVGAGSVGVEEEDDGVGIVGAVDSEAVFPDVGPRAPATPATAIPGDGGSPAAAATSVSGGEATIAVEQGPAAAIWEKDAAAGGTACAESETLIAVEPTALLVGGVEDDGEADDAAVEDAEVEDAKAHGETLGASSAVVAGDDVETPCSSLAAGDVCTPGAASASSEPLSTRSDEPDKLCDVRDAAIVSPAVSYAGQEAPRDCGPDSGGEGSSGWGGEMSSSPCLSEAPSPVLANDGRIASPATASPACAEPVLGEACGDDSPLAFGDSGEGEGSERTGESGAAAPGGSPPSPGRPGPSPRGSTEHDASDEGSAAAPCSPFSASPAAAAAAASPLVTAGGHGLQQEEPMSGRTPEPVESARREFPSRERPTPPYPFGDAGSPAMSEIAATPGEDEEGAEEIAALKDRLWAAWDAAVLEYEEGVALVRSKYNRSTPAASTTTAQKESAMVSRSPGDASGPTPTAGVAETSRQEGRASASGPKATATPAPSAAASAEETVAEEPAEVVPTAADGMPTPDSPLLPLLQLRLEEEEGDLFEYSSSWRGSGTGGEGSSQAGGGKPRRRSLAKAFSSHKTRKGPKVQEAGKMTAGKMQGAGDSPAQETGESETGGSEGSDGAAAMLCRLCCRKSCDTVLRPCEHSACGVCVEKIRLQAEQSGQALSCPWDRKLVDAICPV